MTPLSLLPSGVLGMALALRNPISSPYILSRFDTVQTLPPFHLRTLQGQQFIRLSGKDEFSS